MAYYIEERLNRSALGARRATVNDYFLSTYTTSIYDGCEIGCPYCDGWSHQTRPFNETVRIPLDYPRRVAEELELVGPGELIGITAYTDAYQAAETSYRLTRQTLRVLADRGQPTLILTKSPMVLEDLVLLERIQAQSLAIVVFTVLATDPFIAEKLEDKAAVTALRLDAISELKRAGIPVGVALIPLIPYVNDTDLSLDSTLRAVAAAGANFVVWDYLNIPDERHRSRINEMLTRIGNYPPSYYRDLYRNQMLPDVSYRQERHRALLSRCDALNLPVRVPHAIYAGKLAPRNEAALLLKHAAFRDAVQGRVNLAQQNYDLADQIFRGTATEAHIHGHALGALLNAILNPQPNLQTLPTSVKRR
jgi:DNA repair photolyase